MVAFLLNGCLRAEVANKAKTKAWFNFRVLGFGIA